MAFMDLLETFGRAFVPESLREPLRLYLKKAGYQNTPYYLFGLLFIAALVVTYFVFLGFAWPIIQGFSTVLVGLSTLVFWLVALGVQIGLVIFFTWTILNLKIYNRTKDLEEHLPEYLDLVVTNLRSGMSFDKSLFAAIRPDFGVLATEVGIVSKRVMTGNDTTTALKEFAESYDSPILRRSLDLIISEVETGGEIGMVIERVVENLRQTKHLKDEMRTSVISYMIFIGAIVLVLSPVLFALANTILAVIVNLAGDIAGGPSGAGGGGFAGGAEALFNTLEGLADNADTVLERFEQFSYVAILTIGFFAGLITSIIEKGDMRGGIKYIPVFMLVSVIFFSLALVTIMQMFGALI